MPRFQRLSRKDFTQMRGFRRVHGELFSFAYGTLPGRNAPGGACVVSSKIAKSAVARNRIKRRVREALRELLASRTSPIVIVCYAKKDAAREGADIRKDILSLKDMIRGSR